MREGGSEEHTRDRVEAEYDPADYEYESEASESDVSEYKFADEVTSVPDQINLFFTNKQHLRVRKDFIKEYTKFLDLSPEASSITCEHFTKDEYLRWQAVMKDHRGLHIDGFRAFHPDTILRTLAVDEKLDGRYWKFYLLLDDERLTALGEVTKNMEISKVFAWVDEDVHWRHIWKGHSIDRITLLVEGSAPDSASRKAIRHVTAKLEECKLMYGHTRPEWKGEQSLAQKAHPASRLYKPILNAYELNFLAEQETRRKKLEALKTEDDA